MNTQDIVPLAVTITTVGIGMLMITYIGWRTRRISRL